MEWISVTDRLPEQDQEGKKVLLYRQVNKSQESMAISIFDTNMVKLCEDSTYWMPLPEPPKQ